MAYNARKSLDASSDHSSPPGAEYISRQRSPVDPAYYQRAVNTPSECHRKRSRRDKASRTSNHSPSDKSLTRVTSSRDDSPDSASSNKSKYRSKLDLKYCAKSLSMDEITSSSPEYKFDHQVSSSSCKQYSPLQLPQQSVEKDDSLEREKLQLLEMLKKLDEDTEPEHCHSPMIIASDEESLSPQLMILTSGDEATTTTELSPLRLSKDNTYLPSTNMSALSSANYAKKVHMFNDRTSDNIMLSGDSMAKAYANKVYIIY